MPATTLVYGHGVKNVANRTVDYVADTIKVALTTSAYTPDQGAHEFFSSVTNELATANGYTAGGATLGTKSITYDATTRETRFKAASTVWTATTGNTIAARRAVIYKSTGSAATSPLLAVVDLTGGGDLSATGADLTIAWDATSGAFRFTAS